MAIAWLFATLLRIAKGSATTAGLMCGPLSDGDLSNGKPALITMAIAADAAGLWLISHYFGMTEAQPLKTWSLVSTAIPLAIILLLNLSI